MVHGGQCFSDNWILGCRRGNLLCQSDIDSLNMEILILSFEQGDFSIIVAGFDFILPGKSISRSHVNSSFHSPLNIVFLREQPPSGLPATKILGLFEVSQVLVIRYHGYRVFSAREIVAPLFEGLDNGEKLSIIYVIVSVTCSVQKDS